jgi:hypothetical protein
VHKNLFFSHFILSHLIVNSRADLVKLTGNLNYVIAKAKEEALRAGK